MKKILIVLGLIMLTLQGGCQSKADNTFEVIVYANKGVMLPGNKLLIDIPAMGVADWNTLLNKPLTFTPATHSHSYSAIIDKPLTFIPAVHKHVLADITDFASIDLQTAIAQMKYIELPQGTTTEINALVMPAGKVVEVWDKTLKCKKVWDGTMWKNYITNQ